PAPGRAPAAAGLPACRPPGRAGRSRRDRGSPALHRRRLRPALPGGLHAGRPAAAGALPGAGRVGTDDPAGLPRRRAPGERDPDRDDPGEPDEAGADPRLYPALALRGMTPAATKYEGREAKG